ncbi:hypothetical protein EF096_01700 [Pseudomonas neustonica]|uniref:Uncharacterized protein n=1 Tax=Pseudomonas neustonica TaxID=2487346 RepID=A0ABX9XNC3_9PSED|nr:MULTISPECIES: hypothetical protein [Pseudomonas]ROZ86954.1 hypothetical protein EF099_01000 [Pseudomonas sp. SSM44]ROZ88430.1 hypothetical protein EF096_01700 [Pseudomonas neustonica]
MTDKPEVVAWMIAGMKEATMHEVTVMDWDDEGEQVESLIRLTDHEAARAADKARIAELVEALRHFIDADSQPSGISGKYGNALTQAVDKLKQEHDQRIAFAVAAIAKSGSGEES